MRRDKTGKGANLRKKFMKKSRETVSEALKSRDMLLGSVTKTIEDLDKTINLLGERLEDWYGIYFPELKTADKIKFAEAVLAIDRDNLDMKELSASLGQKKADEISENAKKTLGANLSPEDLSQCQSLAQSILVLSKLREKYENYQKSLAVELCPNLSEVGGPDLAAKLVSHMGSLAKLAILPASAIQVIGAENALFKHLKNKKRIPSPKHGLIFQHAYISASPKKVRGKIARTLANKLVLAAKADAFSKRNISKDLKESLDSQYKKIMNQYERQKKK